jgi:OPA family glycerol-3-phosphate transporter-like MFS transporter
MEYAAGFRQRRALNWVLAGLMYALFYMARYNFDAINARLSELFGWTNADIGIIATVTTTVYGLAVFFNGPLADKIGGRRALLLGAAGSAVFNFLFGLTHLFLASPAVWEGADKARHVVVAAQLNMGVTKSSLITIMAVMWGANFYFQSFGALSIVKINAAWFHLRERGFFSGIFGILIRLGLLFANFVSPLLLLRLPWHWAFWVPACVLTGQFVLVWLYVRDAPRDAGFADFDTGDESAEEKGKRATLGLVLRKIFGNPTMWVIASASLMVGMVRRACVDTWWQKYFPNVYHFDPKLNAKFIPYQITTWGIVVLGICGGLTFGLVSDRVFGGRRAPVVVLAFGGMAVMLTVGGMLNRFGAGPYAVALSVAALSFFVNGAHGMIGGAVSMDFGGRKAAATAAGLVDGVQYIVAGPVVGYGMGRLLDTYGWNVWLFAPVPFAVLGALVMSRLWNVLPKGAVRAEVPTGSLPSASAR